MLISVMTAGIVPEYSVVRYRVDRDTPRVGYLLRGNGDDITLIEPLGTDFTTLGAEDFVELLATPAATACFYIGKECR